MERSIHQDWVFREKLHADTSSTKCCIYSQVYTFFLTSIEILKKQLCFSISDTTVQVNLKGFLVRFGGTDNFGQEIQSVLPMLQVNAYGIYQQTIGMHLIKVSFAVYSFFRRSVKIQMKTVKRNALHHAQVVADRIITSRSGFQANAR